MNFVCLFSWMKQPNRIFYCGRWEKERKLFYSFRERGNRYYQTTDNDNYIFDGGGKKKSWGKKQQQQRIHIFLSLYFHLLHLIFFFFLPFWLTPCYYQSINQSITSLETKKRCLFVFHHEIRLSDLLIACCLDTVFCFVFGLSFEIWWIFFSIFCCCCCCIFH